MKSKIKYSNEEEIKVHLVIPWLESLGYKKETMEFEKTIEVQEGRKKKNIFADIVIYSNKKRETPLIVVDTKSPKGILSKNDKEQVISYARLLPKIAPLAVLTNGYNIQVFKTLDKSRIKTLPKRKDLLNDFVSTVLSANIEEALRSEAKKELFVIDDVNTFKDLLKKCHTTIRNNEGYDPIKAFDELSKVLFSKMYEEQYNRDNNRFTVEIFDKTLKELNVNIVQQQFAEIQKVENFKDLFPEQTVIELKDRTIKEIVQIFESYDLTLTNFDVKGEAFEYFLGDTFTGGLGEYFTPRNVVEFMVEAISPKIGEKIIDPFCGTGGFLIYAFDIISEKIKLHEFAENEKEKWRYELSNKSLFGTDWKTRTSQACKMNMIVHGDGNTGVFQHNGFKNIEGFIEHDKFDICFTNPPFGANESDEAVLNDFELGIGKTAQKREILAIERCLKLVKPKTGIVAFILPDGILNGDRNAPIREFINKEAEILAVIGLNKATFEGYNTTVKTSVLFLRRKASPDDSLSTNIFMAVCTNSGYAPTGEQISGNQLPDILFDFQNFRKDKKSEHISKYVKIVSPKHAADRIDAERYIDYMEYPELPDNEDISEKVSTRLKNFSSTYTKLNELSAKHLFKNEFKENEFEFIELNQLLQPISNFIKLDTDTIYKQLGIRGNGAGIFIREESLGNAIKATKLNQVKLGWLVFSRLFAKNGSFGIVDERFENGVFSNEFPTYTVKENAKYDANELLIYLVFYLTSIQSTNYIIRLTTGSTKQSRGRFKENQFLELSIPIPKDISKLSSLVKKITLINETRLFLENLKADLDVLNKSFQISLPKNK